MMARWSVVGLIVLSWARVAPGQLSVTGQGVLALNFTDTRGLKITSGVLSIASSEGKLVYRSEVGSRAVVRLPYGRYEVTFDAESFRSAHRDVVIDKPECFVVMASAFVPEGKGPSGSISIKVEPAISCVGEGPLWAKLVGIFADVTEQREISTAGFALFDPVDAGAYVVIVVDGSRVRATLPISTTRMVTTATLDLSPCLSK